MSYDATNYQQTTPTVTGLTLLAVMLIIYPSPSKAQVPLLEEQVVKEELSSPRRQLSEYTLGGGDRIHIDIIEIPQYSGDYQITPAGSLTLPLIGSVFVEGLTPVQAAQLLSDKYNSFLKYPLVTVTLVTPRPLNVFVAGEVNRPGSYALDLAEGAGSQPGVQYPTLSQVIELAGGVTLTADIREVEIRRRNNIGSEDVIKVDIWELVQTGKGFQNLMLRDGDTIFIPSITSIEPTQENYLEQMQRYLTEVRQIATTGFAPKLEEPRTVAIVGEVKRPGSYVVIGGDTTSELRTLGVPSVTKAIQLAGGIKPMADIRQIQVRRVSKAGTEQIIPVNLWQLLKEGDFKQDTILQDGDTIIVPTATEVSRAEATELAEASFSPETIQVGVVGEVTEPGLVEVPANTPLNQALLAAGGFDQNRARKSSVELIRLNLDGTVSQRTVPIDFTQGINEETNPILHNNDVIIVNRSGLVSVIDTLGTILSPVNPIFALFRIFDLFSQ